MDRELSTREDP